LFAYPEDIRKAIYTTNAIESLNSVIRKAIKKRKLFPHDDAAKKSGLSGDAGSIKKVDYADS
jgi:putative transposase